MSTDARFAPGDWYAVVGDQVTVVLPGRKGAVAAEFMMVPSGLFGDTPNGKMVANGVPRVSTERPRSGWKVFTKPRWSPRSTLASVIEAPNITLNRSSSRSPWPAMNEKRQRLPPPASVTSMKPDALAPWKSS